MRSTRSFRRALLALGLSLVPLPLAAQTPDEQAVLDVVVRLFDGMRARDTAVVRSVFHPEARLATTAVRDGVPVVRTSAIDDFIAAVGRATEVLDERIYDPEVRVDGTLAAVWTFYTLHVGGRFSHCGVDAFHLARTEAGWKIVQIADTRRREGCEPAGAPKSP